MTDELTPRQLECLEAVIGFIRENKKSPTVRDVGAALGLKSSHPAYRLLLALYEKGYVTWTSEGRSLQVLRKPPRKKKAKPKAS